MSLETGVNVGVAVILLDLAIRITALVLIPRNRTPSAAMAWLLTIFLVPVVGGILFLVIGNEKLPRGRRERQVAINRVIRENVPEGLGVDPGTWPRWFRGLTEQNQALGAMPVSGGNHAELIDDYQASIDRAAHDIDAAERFVHVEYFVVGFDRTTRGFFAAMERAVQRGVPVRLLMDHIPSRSQSVHRATIAELDRIGVDWRYMLPVQPLKRRYQRPDLRNHRKLVVVDGRVAHTGSQNLVDRAYNKRSNERRGLQWQELTTRVTGPVVAAVNAVFLSDWYAETGEGLDADRHVPAAELLDEAPGADALVCQIIPSGPSYEHENNLRLFLGLVASAQERVIITSPYFVPDEAMMLAITSARLRGLDVELFVSEVGDQGPVWHAQRSYYDALLRAGVRIFLYPSPYILHAKHLSIDDDVAVIGSSNLDIRSFVLNFEITMLVRGASFVAGMREVEASYRELSRELTLQEWRREPRSRTFLDGVFRLTSSLQ